MELEETQQREIQSSYVYIVCVLHGNGAVHAGRTRHAGRWVDQKQSARGRNRTTAFRSIVATTRARKEIEWDKTARKYSYHAKQRTRGSKNTIRRTQQPQQTQTQGLYQQKPSTKETRWTHLRKEQTERKLSWQKMTAWENTERLERYRDRNSRSAQQGRRDECRRQIIQKRRYPHYNRGYTTSSGRQHCRLLTRL